jgi:NADPH:quinone reductase-like Zn-dependent oxidoreductase
MKAAIVKAPGSNPVYGDFDEPVAQSGQTIVTVRASALTQLTKSRASGSHYSSDGAFPAIAGTDGVGRTTVGQRVYFVLPETPFGALAERSLVKAQHCIPLPDDLDDITAAAIANPGMSAWVAMMERARLKTGETVLVNGATGTAGRLAVQLAKYIGAAKVIATGRNEEQLEEVRALGADVTIPFTLGTLHPLGAKRYEEALMREFANGIDVVVDYLWGESARTIIAAIAKSVEDATPVRFVHVGGASGEESIDLPGAGLRSSAIVLMGSGLKSVRSPALLEAIKSVFEATVPARLQIATKTVPLSEVEEYWSAPGKPRGLHALLTRAPPRQRHRGVYGRTTVRCGLYLEPATMKLAHLRGVTSLSQVLECTRMKLHRIVPLLCAFSAMAAQSPFAMAQAPVDAGNPSVSAAPAPQGTTPGQLAPTYVRPTEKIKIHNYLFDAFGPYPIAGAAIAAGINQAKTRPPEWGQGAGALGERFGSSLAIAATTTTTRYGLAEAFREDTLYYQCECKGVLRRLEHAAISTLTARRGDDGHREFSAPALVSPYVGTMTAVYAWYPGRYSYQDALRMGNYTLLGLLAQNIATEFLYGGPHSLLSRSHLSKSHGVSNPGANN